MRTRLALLGVLLLVTTAAYADPHRATAGVRWYAALAAAPIDVEELRNDLRVLVGLEANRPLLNENQLPDAAEIDQFDISDSSREWLAASRVSVLRQRSTSTDRYALLWAEESSGSAAFEMSDRTSRRLSRDGDSADLFIESEAREGYADSEPVFRSGDLSSLVLAD